MILREKSFIQSITFTSSSKMSSSRNIFVYGKVNSHNDEVVWDVCKRVEEVGDLLLKPEGDRVCKEMKPRPGCSLK